jgi:hypothetical protein
MIHVQIASEVTADGVRGVRWVLLDAFEPAQPDVAATAETEGTGRLPVEPLPAFGPPNIAPAAAAAADSRRLPWLKALMVTAGLGAALWTASVQIGLPGRGAPAAAGAASAATLPPVPATAASSTLADTPSTKATDPGGAVRAVPAPPRTPAAHGTPAATRAAPSTPASGGRPRLTASI